MRIAHFTDLHLLRPPSVGGLIGKRLLGAANLYLAGRSRRFSEASAGALVEAVLALEPDLCVCTGDLTAMASEAEFEAARALLEPLTARWPLVVVPGNHDVYTRGSLRERRFERHFGAWSGGRSYPALQVFGEVAFIGLDCVRPHPLLATGVVPAAQLSALEAMLGSQELEGRAVVVLLHHPLRDRDGAPYRDGARKLLNAAELERVLAARSGLTMILHGHEHHGFATTMPAPAGPIPIFDPGAGGRTEAPGHAQTAHFNLYEVSRAGLLGVERWALRGGRFAPEPGGPYATGR
ncbi:MAG: metallophosphoesterase [Pseudomonadota bacterium]